MAEHTPEVVEAAIQEAKAYCNATVWQAPRILADEILKLRAGSATTTPEPVPTISRPRLTISELKAFCESLAACLPDN